MKLDKLKNLFRAKRVIALALAAAMTVTSLPQTAYAAEAAPETETAVEVQEEDEQPVETTEEADNSAEENIESAPSETDTEEAAAGTTQPATTEAVETKTTEAASTSEVQEAAGTSEVQEADENEAENHAEGDSTPAETTYKLVNNLKDDAEVKTKTYDSSAPFTNSSNAATPIYGILSKIEIQGSDDSKDTLSSDSAVFTYKWQKNGEDSKKADTDPVTIPKNAGAYQLVITPNEGSKYAKAEPLVIKDFVIKQKDIDLDSQFSVLNVKPGTPVNKVVDEIKTLRVNGVGETFTYTAGREKNDLTVSVTVIDPYTNNATSDPTIKKTGDYFAQITVGFSSEVKDEVKGNYNLLQASLKKINVADLKETTMKLKNVSDGAAETMLSDNSGKTVPVISKNYGDTVATPTYSAEITEKEAVKDENGKEQYKAVSPNQGEITGAWYTAEFRSWSESVVKTDDEGKEVTDEKTGEPVYEIKPVCSLTVGNELGEGKTPTEAGAYVYRVTYSGDKEQYAGTSADIVVNIAPVGVAVTPAAMDGAAFYDNETVESVLSKITYKLDKTVPANIWGTSYDDANKTQPYEPEFGVYRVKTVGTEKVAEIMAPADKVIISEGVTYEVRFTRNKIVRYESGDSASVEVNEDVDSFNSNYRTATDEKTIAANVYVLTPAKGNVTIDTTPITTGWKEAKEQIDGNKVYTKVYSEDSALYETRADYKKAAVTGGDAANLTYKWYKWSPALPDDLDSTIRLNARYDVNVVSAAVFNGNLNFKNASNWDGSLEVNTEDYESYVKRSLSDAGIYKLEITYDDGAAYKQENVYYAIERQQLRFRPTSVPAAYYNTNVSNYIDANSLNFAPVLEINQNNEGNWAAMDSWTQGKDGDYTVSSTSKWFVQAKAPEEKDADGKVTTDWDGWQQQYSFTYRPKVDDKAVEQNQYRLASNMVVINGKKHTRSNYVFTEYSAVDVKSDDETSKPTKRIDVNLLSTAGIEMKETESKSLTFKGLEKTEYKKTYDAKPIEVNTASVKYVDEAANKEITPQIVWEWNYTDKDGISRTSIVKPEEAVNGGTYTIYAIYTGDAEYTAQKRTVATATIEKAALKVSVKPFAENESIDAGKFASSVYSNYTNNEEKGDFLTVTGFPTDEKADVIGAFTKWEREEDKTYYQYSAWETKPAIRVYGKDDKTPLEESTRLKSNEEYTLKVYSFGTLADPYRYNYKFETGDSAKITVVPVSSSVEMYSYNGYVENFAGADLSASDSPESGTTEKFAHNVTFRASIPHADVQVTENGKTKTVYGSYATVRIQLPDEFTGEAFPDTTVYENALKKAGAVKVQKGTNYNNYIYAVFNFSKDGENGLEPVEPITFAIAWRPGFVEKFTITATADNLAADLRKAVAPKSVAFNAPKTKMVVGEMQDLDVKVTKVQNEDLVYLDYKIAASAPEDVLAINSQGRITALKEGTATVEVYPVKVVNNEKVQITTVKAAQVKIVVSKVTAPKVGQIIPADESVDVQYPYVKNNSKYYDYGYRREIYVMPENKVTVDAFEAAIAKFEASGDYLAAGLAAEPFYISNEEEDNFVDDAKHNYYGQSFEEYLSDNSAAAIVNGKNMTIQARIDGLTPNKPYSVYVRNVSAQRTVLDKDGNKKTAQLSANGMTRDFKTTLGQVKALVVLAEAAEGAETKTAKLQENGKESKVPYYEYQLNAKNSVQLTVTGFFSAVEEGTNQAAEYPDLSKGYIVPFTSENKKDLSTKLLEPKLEYRLYQAEQAIDGSWNFRDYYNEITGSWEDGYRAAKYTKADKKGKLTFTQPEALIITAYDTVTRTESDPIIVFVTAAADSAAGKKVTLQVGQRTPVVDLAAYKAGTYALDSRNPYFDHTATTAGNDYFEVEAYEDGTTFITPVKFDKASAKQSVTVTGTPSVSGASEVTIKELDPVKNLKFNNLIDNSFILDFQPSRYADGYIIDIKNSVGSLVQRKFVPQEDFGDMWRYSAEKKAYVLRDGYTDIFEVSGLKAKSKYNVSVTAVYGDSKSKPASKTITMTKIPAWNYGLAADGYNDGMPVEVFAKGYVEGSIDSYAFVSGNRYTLVADANAGAKYAVTDKLTWSSSDGKVAKVSAVGGTYSATLKALKAGTTTIEVRSGILKQVIARWRITVRSVGDAYNYGRFYDEDESLRDDDGLYDGPYDNITKLVLNVPAEVELAAGESRRFTFTPEETATYTVIKSNGMNCEIYCSGSWVVGEPNNIWVHASEDEPASGTITVVKVPGDDKKDRIELSLGEPTKWNGYRWAVFTSTEDKLYKFSSNGEIELYKRSGSEYTSVKHGYLNHPIEYALKANTSIYVRNVSGSDSTIKVSKVAMDSLSTGERSLEKGKTYWYEFTSEEADYRFSGEGIGITIYKDLDAINNNNGDSGSGRKKVTGLKAGDKIYVNVSASQDTTLKVEKIVPVAITDDKSDYPDTAFADEETSYSLTPTADAVYTFAFTGAGYGNVNIGIFDEQNKPVKNYTYSYTRELTYPLKKGVKYSVRVNNNNSSDLSLKVTKTEIGALELDKEPKAFAEAGAELKGNYAYLSFTAPEEGSYRFTFNNTSGSYGNVYMMNEPSDNTDTYTGYGINRNRNTIVDHYLSVGKKVWLQLNSTSMASDVTVTVAKAGKGVEKISADDTTPKPIDAGTIAWYQYNVTENGRYEVTVASDASWDIYKDMEKQEETVEERYWKNGSSIFIKVTNQDDANSVDATITVKKIVPEKWKGEEVSISSGETKWYAFTAEEDDYKFVCEDETGNFRENVKLYTQELFEAEGRHYPDTIEESTIYLLAKDETVYLKVSALRNITLKAEAVEVKSLYTGTPNSVDLEDGDGLCKFYVSKTGIYTFTPNNGETMESLYLYTDRKDCAEDANLAYSWDGGTIRCPLIEGTTAYLRIENCYSSEQMDYLAEYNLSVKMDETINLQEITLGQETTLSLTGNEKKWLCFRAADNKYSSYRIDASSDNKNYIRCYFTDYYSESDDSWESNMGSTSINVGPEIIDYGELYSEGHITCMYLLPDNTGDVKLTINEIKD